MAARFTFQKLILLPLLATVIFVTSASAQPQAAASAPIRVEELAAPARTTPVTVESQQKSTHNTLLAAPSTEKKAPQISSLSFSWNIPVNLAVFKRQNKLWIVFDHPQMVNLEEIRKTAGSLAENIFHFPHPGATIIQMAPREDVQVFVRKEGLLWIVDLISGNVPPAPLKDMTIFTQYDSLKRPYLFMPTETAGNIVAAIDPDVGDIITIAPTADVGYGLNQPYRYPEFEMLDTKQGLAFVIKTSDIILSRGNTGFTLRAFNRGLNITDDLENLKRRQLFKQSEDSLETFDLKIPASILSMSFGDAVEQLKQDIAKAPVDKKNQARLELVKYYLAQGLGTEALHILEQMDKAKLPEASSDKFFALKGVANFLTRRYQQAAENFQHGNLPQSGEAKFWHTLSKSAIDYRPEHNKVLFSYVSTIRDYPIELRDRIAVIAAWTAIQAGDDLSAQNFIDILKSGDNERLKDRSEQIAYLNARKLQLQGYPRNAIRDYRILAAGKSLRYSALARYDNAVLSQQIGIMPLKNAIAELEQLRFAWNETIFKQKLLNHLAALYVKDSDYYNALRTLQDSLPLVDAQRKKTLVSQMIRLFEDIYINNQADEKLSALKALALYQDFEWLGRLSDHQNEIIQKLADRLVAVDLLPRAQELLQSLLRKDNLSIEDRGRIGARLAVIFMFENLYPDALDVLDATENPSLSAEAKAHRRVIRAKTLAGLNRIPDALSLLQDDYSKNAILLKVSIFWNAGRWAEASDTIKYLIEKPTPGKPLTLEQINYILDWATALKQAGKEAVLVRLRNKFMPYFASTKYHSAFNILTNHLENDKVDLKQINEIVNDVQNFSNFTKLYNDSLKNYETK